jgi:hypothetical protein
MAGNLTPAQLHDLAVTLENEQAFYNAYRAEDPDCARARRDCIQYHAKKLVMKPGNGHDCEHLRRYFDEQYGMPEATVYTYPKLPLLEFWLDRVKYPEADGLPAHLKEGAQLDVSYAKKPGANDRERWARYGRPWEDHEYTMLKQLFWGGKNLEQICITMNRPPNGVLNKLHEAKCVEFDQSGYHYIVRKKTPANSAVPFTSVPDKAPPQEFGEVIIDSAVSQPTALTFQEILMNKTDIIKIETKTYVNDVDVATLNDSEIYSLIAAQEAQVEELEKIKTKPKKLVAEIEKRKAGIQALVDYLDSKE